MIWTVFNDYGQRKYLNIKETESFIKASNNEKMPEKAFCLLIAFTGCRISEALSITIDSIDFSSKHVIFKSLKKRGKIFYRAVPLPPRLIDLFQKWAGDGGVGHDRLWPWSRMTGYRRICEVMGKAGIYGSYASPKGLRHGFGVRAIQAGVPLTLVQRWLGHADVKTTAIYTSVMGPEERAIASRMWRKRPLSSHLSDQYEKSLTVDDIFKEEEAPRSFSSTIVEPGAEKTQSLTSAGPRNFVRPHPSSRSEKSKNSLPSCRLIQFWLKCNEENYSLSISYDTNK